MKCGITMGGRWKISAQELDPVRTAIACGRDLRISYKHAVEVCNAIRGMKLDEARRLLEDVIALKRPIPFRRYHGKVGHRRGLQKWAAGRYPVKTAKEVLKLLDQLEANAAYKGLDLDRIWIIHAVAHKGMKIRKYIPRAFGRATPYFQQLVHIELAVEER